MSPKSANDIQLSSNTTVKQYREMEITTNRDAISKFVEERFSERYIKPLKHPTAHGFAIMANCCLLIETIECFRHGWPETPGGKGSDLFRAFFDRQAGEMRFVPFKGKGPEFYKHVRCGILHQGETTGGWLINRRTSTKLLAGKDINARKFQKELTHALEKYCDELESAPWNDPLWTAFRYKMNSIIANCS